MMKMQLRSLFFAVVGMVLFGCSDDKKSSDEYAAVEEIFLQSCGGSSCHVAEDHDFQKIMHDDTLGGGLNLESWESTMEGSHHGAVVIPYNSRFSHMMKHLTGEQDLMPPSGMLSQDKIDVIRQWMDRGAPGPDGQIAFSGATSRIFTTNQDSDVVSVIDETSRLVMRVFQVGVHASFESPHGLQVSPDGDYYYVSMIVGQTVLKYHAATGQMIDSVNLGKPLALIKLSEDGSKLYVTTNFDANNAQNAGGVITVISTATMTVSKQIEVGVNPHGINLSRDGRLIYATTAFSDKVYVIDTESDSLLTSFEVETDPTPNPDFEPYHVTPGLASTSAYEDLIFVTCRKDGKVRMFQRQSNFTTGQHTFTPMGLIDVGLSSASKPIQMDLTPDGNKLYVANYADNTVSVIVKNGSTYTFSRNITSNIVEGDTLRFSGPNGVAISRNGHYAYVTNRNRTGGVIGHHGGTGGGFLSVIDVLTDELIQTIEMPPDAYSVVVTP